MVRLEPYHLMSLALEPQPWNTNKFMATATWKWHKVGHGSREKPRCTFLGLTLLDVFLFFPWVHVWPTERFFLGWGGGRAGQKFAVFPTTRFPVLAPRLLLWNAEHRAKHEAFCWKGIKMEMTERFWSNNSQVDCYMMPNLSFIVRFSSRPAALYKNDTN